MKITKENTSEERLEEILILNPIIKEILERVPKFGLENYYLAAGCIAHTVWNHLSGFELTNGIKDYDLVYFDNDTSFEAEDGVIKKGRNLFGYLDANIEIRNEARVHLWYEKHFGYKINPYKSLEKAIDTFPTTATTIGVRKDNGKFIIYATYGLDDLLNMVVRANKVKITEEIYLNKVNRWSKIWPQLKVIPW